MGPSDDRGDAADCANTTWIARGRLCHKFRRIRTQRTVARRRRGSFAARAVGRNGTREARSLRQRSPGGGSAKRRAEAASAQVQLRVAARKRGAPPPPPDAAPPRDAPTLAHVAAKHAGAGGDAIDGVLHQAAMGVLLGRVAAVRAEAARQASIDAGDAEAAARRENRRCDAAAPARARNPPPGRAEVRKAPRTTWQRRRRGRVAAPPRTRIFRGRRLGFTAQAPAKPDRVFRVATANLWQPAVHLPSGLDARWPWRCYCQPLALALLRP